MAISSSATTNDGDGGAIPGFSTRRSRAFDYDAVVVGAGPNGLAAAITLARASRSVLVVEASPTVGGGTRTKELTLPGFHHDVCSAIHPLGIGSPFFKSLPLVEQGLEWIEPPLALANPLDDGPPALLKRGVAETAETLGLDGDSYRRLMGPLVARWEDLLFDLLGPLRVPRNPILAARFGLQALRSCEGLVRGTFRGEAARTLFAGMCAHSTLPLDQPMTASFGLMLATLAHGVGWPLARGGSRRITEEMATYLRYLGGEIRVDFPVATLEQLPRARAYFFDVTPRQILAIAARHLPGEYRDDLQAYRYGAGVFKVDWALDGPIPWRDAQCRDSGTVHLGASYEEIARSEAAIARGDVSDRPYVILTQQSLFDSTRAPAGKHTGWAYCHVPNGCTLDMTGAIEAQVERFAPGFRDLVLARHVMSPAAMQAYNGNYVGGDINGGTQDYRQFFTRPTPRLVPYTTPNPSLFMCSSATPPGGGVHGMCGYYAAQAALSRVLK